MANNEHNPVKDDLSTIWDILKSVAFFLGIYLFFIGWLHLYYYFMQFGISYGMIKFEVTTIYNYGFLALMHDRMLITFAVFIIIFFVVYYHRRSMPLPYAITFAAIIIFFNLSYFIVKADAVNDANAIILKESRQIPFPVYFDFTKDFLQSMSKDSLELRLLDSDNRQQGLNRTINDGVKLMRYNNMLELSLFFENDDYYYVLYNPNNPNQQGHNSYDIQIFSINKKNLNYASVLKTPVKAR